MYIVIISNWCYTPGISVMDHNLKIQKPMHLGIVRRFACPTITEGSWSYPTMSSRSSVMVSFLIVADSSSYSAHRSKKGWKKGNVRHITYPCRRIRHSARTYGPFWRHHDIFPNPIKNSDDLLDERIILVLRLKQEKSVLTSLYLYKDGNWRNNNNYNIRSFKVVLLSPLLPLVQYLVVN